MTIILTRLPTLAEDLTFGTGQCGGTHHFYIHRRQCRGRHHHCRHIGKVIKRRGFQIIGLLLHGRDLRQIDFPLPGRSCFNLRLRHIMSAFMRCQITRLCESFHAPREAALIRFLPSVYSKMCLQVKIQRKALATEFAPKGFLSSVHEHVPSEF